MFNSIFICLLITNYFLILRVILNDIFYFKGYTIVVVTLSPSQDVTRERIP